MRPRIITKINAREDERAKRAAKARQELYGHDKPAGTWRDIQREVARMSA